MPQLLDSGDRARHVRGVINHLLVERGASALTIRTIADSCGLSTSSLHHHFGDRERVISVACHWTLREWVDELELRSGWLGLDAFLPRNEADVRATTAVLAWWEYGRTDPHLAKLVSDAQLDQRALLKRVLGPSTPHDDLEAAIALVRGLLLAICVARPALPLQTGHELLRRLDGTRSHAADSPRSTQCTGEGTPDLVR